MPDMDEYSFDEIRKSRRDICTSGRWTRLQAEYVQAAKKALDIYTSRTIIWTTAEAANRALALALSEGVYKVVQDMHAFEALHQKIGKSRWRIPEPLDKNLYQLSEGIDKVVRHLSCDSGTTWPVYVETVFERSRTLLYGDWYNARMGVFQNMKNAKEFSPRG